ncbi:MAG TPA: hypothetical protein PK225_15875 [Azonexus sp.]|nr:hypothetical protein [Candidatus Accumulibacter phosphatis]MCC2868647.1 hypothetical protein [Candidatus Accumulibacter phosphatis]MCQ1547884.1 hypothetical protein [Candidatus Accumulibacter phosphatis]HRH15812.1 hypothetical protein [Azonexus sp.]
MNRTLQFIIVCCSMKRILQSVDYKTRSFMQNMTLEQFRATVESGGILSVVLKAQGAAFAIQAETQRGDAVLVDTRRKLPRLFGDPRKALALLREMGIRKAAVDTEAWRPEQADSLHPPRPDKSVKLKAAHEAAELKRVLDERIAMADAQGAIWHEAEDVFDELAAAHAG